MADYDFSGVDAIDSGTPPSPQPQAPVPQNQPSSQSPGGYDFSGVDDIDARTGIGNQALTALEQGVSGATLGLSKKAETLSGITTPEKIAERESDFPGTSWLANSIGTGWLLAGTGGLSATGALGVGAGLGAINRATDDWTNNKPLTAQNILASAGIGAVFNLAGHALGKATGKVLGIAPEDVSNAQDSRVNVANDPNIPVDPLTNPDAVTPENPLLKSPEPPGSNQSKSIDELAERLEKLKWRDDSQALPQKAAILDAESRLPDMQLGLLKMQTDALDSPQALFEYEADKELGGKYGQKLISNEYAQKNERTLKTDSTIRDIAPGSEPTDNAVDGGKSFIDAATDQYKNEQENYRAKYKDAFSKPYNGNMAQDMVTSLSNIDGLGPKIQAMIKSTPDGYELYPWSSAYGVEESTYNAVKSALEGAQNERVPDSLDKLQSIRKTITKYANPAEDTVGAAEIRSVRANILQQMMDSTDNPDLREAYKQQAINEQNRNVIERDFKASVGTPEFGSISKINPKDILPAVFKNTSSVQAAKSILPREDFNTALANWIMSEKGNATKDGAFSANKFGTFLNNKRYELNEAFSHADPAINAQTQAQLQRLKDLNITTRYFPDKMSANPPHTARTTLYGLIKNFDPHYLSPTAVAAAIPKKIAELAASGVRKARIDKALSEGATGTNLSNELVKHSQITSDQIDNAIKAIFGGAAAQSRKFK